MTDSTPTMEPWEEAAKAQASSTPTATATMEPWEEAQKAGVKPPEQSSSGGRPQDFLSKAYHPLLAGTAAGIGAVAAIPADPETLGMASFAAGAAAYPAGQEVANSIDRLRGMETPDASLGKNLKEGARTMAGAQMAIAGTQLASDGASALYDKIFQKAPDLLNAGIKPSTVLKMTPNGQNPAVFGESLEQELNAKGALGNDPQETWDLMNGMRHTAGQKVGDYFAKIAELNGPKAIQVDGKEALQPILEGWAERAGADTTARKAMARPFEQIYNGLAEKSAAQNGYLTIDNIHSAMDEIGPLVHKGPEATQVAMSELYATLAQTQEAMVRKVAEKASNESLATGLLKANKDYSQLMRLMPDIDMSAAKYAVKQGVSAFERYGGSKVLKTAEHIGAWEGIKKLIGSFGDSR